MAITLNISGEVDGTFTIEDDGILGNGISVLRRPNGTIFTTFAHPADALSIVSRPGQNVSVNFVDSLTTSSFTIGSLTDPSMRPGAILIGGVLTSNTVTLTAGGTISELGNDAATDIVAGKLFLDAGSGIGMFNPIETQVSVLEAESVNGGINLSNISALTIGGATGTAELRGLFTGTSGNINLVNQGAILLADQDGIESAHSAGSLTMSAIGATASFSSSVNRDALFASGNIFLNAGQDVVFGRGGADFDNDVRAGGSIFINAGRDFAIDGFSDMAADDQGLATGGGVTIIAGRDLLIDDSFGLDASIGVTASGGTGSVYLQTGTGGTLVLHANSSAAIQGRSGGVTIAADRLLLESDSGINVSGGGVATLTTASAGRGIVLGSVTDGVTALELSDAELDRVVASQVVVGSTSAGSLEVAQAISHTNNSLVLRSGGDIVLDANVTTPQSLTLAAGENILHAATSLITTNVFNASVDTPNLDPGGGTLVVIGSQAITSNLLNGNGGNDTITGGASGEVITGGLGNDTIDGGGGLDLAVFGSIVGSTVVHGGGVITVTGVHGTDTLTNVEQLLFTDTGKRSFGATSLWTTANSGAPGVGWHIGDFDGDGRDDAFRYVPGTSGADMFLSNGAAFVAAGSWTGSGNGNAGWHVGDFNGDGRDDIFRYLAGSSGADMFLSNGSGFVAAGSWTGAGSGQDGWYVGDFNGDGRDDIFRYVPGTSGAEMFLSTGTGFAAAGSWVGAGNGADGWHIADFNADGREDIMRYLPGVSGGDVFLSIGSAFASNGSWTGAGPGNEGWYLGDFNGDGTGDLMRVLPGGAEVLL